LNQETVGARYIRRLGQIIEIWDDSCLTHAYEVLSAARESEATVFIAGNGGSAATASHMATDFGIGSVGRVGLRAVALTDNNAAITAIGNDLGFDNVFSRQLELLAKPGDVLICISASGNSPSIIRAIEVARDIGLTSIGLSGFDGGQLKEMANVSIHVNSEIGEYGPVEDMHLIINHALTSWLRSNA
jgi:D-sedoheptulose 7-phosphate isomerase